MQQHGGGEDARISTLFGLDRGGILPDAHQVGGIVRAVAGIEGMRQEGGGKRLMGREGGGVGNHEELSAGVVVAAFPERMRW